VKKKINLKEYFEAMNLKINDLTIKVFHFNMVQVNTLVCYDETKEGVIVDPGMSSVKENIRVKYIINTHPHVDHIVGNEFCMKNFNAPLVAHEAGLPFYKEAPKYGTSFGFPNYEYPMPNVFVNDNENLTFGNQTWKMIYTPGHADGSICLFDEKNKILVVGDVLFAGSIGRTDLPTGNFHQLIQNIKDKLLPLGDEVIVIPGHAETTTIGNEKMYNPYL
jgi:glyoxylase-like metal-dependent hydrolase (beta-lactamase superfamily II)